MLPPPTLAPYAIDTTELSLAAKNLLPFSVRGNLEALLLRLTAVGGYARSWELQTSSSSTSSSNSTQFSTSIGGFELANALNLRVLWARYGREQVDVG